MTNKVTSKRVAKIAANLLPNKNLSKKTKAPIASALSQREKAKKENKQKFFFKNFSNLDFGEY